MNWINKDNSYFLEYDNTLLISVDTDGNYYLFNNKENQKYLVGVQGDSENVIKSNAEEIMKQYTLTVKNASAVLLAGLINLIKTEGSDDSGVYKKLVNARFLPPTVIPQYVLKYINPEDLVKTMNDDGGSMRVLDLYNDIISIDPSTQSVASVTNTNNGRNVIIEEAIDFIAKSNKNSLVVTQGEKIFEGAENYISSEETPLKGFSIKLEDVYSTISVVFLGDCIYIIVVDEINSIDEMFKYDDNVQEYILNSYGIDLNSYFNTEPINEDFDISKVDDAENNNDDNLDTKNTDTENVDANNINTENVDGENMDGEQDNSFNFDSIVSENDEEYIQELEIIQRNIKKIESLPDEIRYNADIEEVYLLLLGKKEQIQKLSDTEKSDKIIDKVVSEISTELGNIEGLTNIKKDDDSNDLENHIDINEGREFNFKGKLIKPVIINKFGVFEKSLIIDKKMHKINESADIRKILESYIADDDESTEDIINKLMETEETVIINRFRAYKIIELRKNNNLITFKCWKYSFKELENVNNDVNQLINNTKPFRNVTYDINNSDTIKLLTEDINYFSII